LYYTLTRSLCLVLASNLLPSLLVDPQECDDSIGVCEVLNEAVHKPANLVSRELTAARMRDVVPGTPNLMECWLDYTVIRISKLFPLQFVTILAH